MADGAACHGPKAPRAEDSRAGAYEDAVNAALAAGDPAALRALDPALGLELSATGPLLWPLLSAAAAGQAWTGEVLHHGAPVRRGLDRGAVAPCPPPRVDPSRAAADGRRSAMASPGTAGEPHRPLACGALFVLPLRRSGGERRLLRVGRLARDVGVGLLLATGVGLARVGEQAAGVGVGAGGAAARAHVAPLCGRAQGLGALGVLAVGLAHVVLLLVASATGWTPASYPGGPCGNQPTDGRTGARSPAPAAGEPAVWETLTCAAAADRDRRAR